MRRWQIRIGEAFAVEKGRVSEGFGDVKNVLDVLRSDAGLV